MDTIAGVVRADRAQRQSGRNFLGVSWRSPKNASQQAGGAPRFEEIASLPEAPNGLTIDPRHPVRLSYGEPKTLETSRRNSTTGRDVEFYCGVTNISPEGPLRVPNIFAGRSFVVEPRDVVGRCGVLAVVPRDPSGDLCSLVFK